VAGSLSRSAIAWALGHALRFAIGTCVVALVAATTLSGAAAERFATAGYLAAIVAGLALALGRFFPRVGEQPTQASAVFPVFLAYLLGIVVLVSLLAVQVSQPAGEVFAIVTVFAAVVMAVLLRSGAVSDFNAALKRGGVLAAVSRYAVVGATASLALAAYVGGDGAEDFVKLGFRFTVVAAASIAASLSGKTAAGAWLRAAYARAADEVDRLSREFFFERTAIYGAIVAVAAMVVASLLATTAEPFAIAAYVAAIAAALGVAMEARRSR
jgi:hypothetical protein